jgi:hypothetical protein
MRNTDLLLVLCGVLLVVGGLSAAAHHEYRMPIIHPGPPTPLKRPILTEAIGRVESGMCCTARGKHGERGAWQVQGRIWGRVPRGLEAQARQHERILDELLKASGGSVSKAVERYNGAGPAARRYVVRVRRMAFTIALLGVAGDEYN